MYALRGKVGSKAARLFAALLLTLVAARFCFLPLGASALSTPPAASIATPTGFAEPEFARAWQRTDGPVVGGQVTRSWVWGPQPGASLSEQYAQGQNGQRQVQYYDKARMELNPAVTDPTSPWRVTTGLLVSELVTGRVQVGDTQFVSQSPSQGVLAGDSNVGTNPRYADFSAAVLNKAPDLTGQAVMATLQAQGTAASAGAGVLQTQYVPQTQHNIPDVFWTYLHKSGPIVNADGTTSTEVLFDWVYLMGYPISEAYWCKVTISGKSYTALVQLFQRRTLTYIADMPADWQVQMGNVGLHYYDWRYGNSSPTGGASPGSTLPTPPTSASIPQSGSWVGINGDQFVYSGATVKLKGTNYWLSNAPFDGTWASWNGPKVLAELQHARDLGVNVVRVGIPFDHKDTMDVLWDSDPHMKKISPWIQSQLTQFLQIAGVLGMKVIFSLFEWNDDQPPVGSEEERQDISYLQGIIGPFANDDRVLAWDIHNEPDNYETWSTGNKDKVIEWLRRISGYIRSIDPHHPLTVGVGAYSNLWATDSTGGSILDFVDFASFHCYDAGALASQAAAIKAHTKKPILLGEMGWPTSPGAQTPTPGATYDEPTQTFLYTHMLADAKQSNIGGVVQWTLYDYTIGSSGPLANYEEHFGLVRLDGSFKPAAGVFRDSYPARILPSASTSNLPLDTADHPHIK